MEPPATPPLDYATPPAAPSLEARRRRRRNGLLVALALLPLLIGWPLATFLPMYLRLEANLAKASAHAAKLRVMVANDPRFAHVEFSEFTESHGMLLITGYVDSQGDLSALNALVAASNPPVHFGGPVSVLPTPRPNPPAPPATRPPTNPGAFPGPRPSAAPGSEPGRNPKAD